MSPRWSKLLENLGKRVVRPPAVDRTQTMAAFDLGGGARIETSPHELSELLGPPPGSPWRPFHCPTLFAVLQSARDWRFGEAIPVPPWVDDPPPGGPPAWLEAGTALFIDLPGPAAVYAAASLRLHHDVQTICTFDNWPHSRQIHEANLVLHACLRVLPFLRERRPTERADAPPVWVCDSERITGASPMPGRYDNRYYVDDSLLPGIQTLRDQGVVRVVYLCSGPGELPLPDLGNFFADLAEVGIELLRVDVEDARSWAEPYAMATPRREELPVRNFSRSDVGGFGVLIAMPPSNGGSAAGAAGASTFRSTSFRGG